MTSDMTEPTDEQNRLDRPTADSRLHTGGERPVDPEDLVRLSGREPTPALIEKARRALEEDGAAAIEKYLP